MTTDGQSRGASGRKRKRPLPASDSSKSTSTAINSGGGHGGGTCPISASLCSASATTQSLNNHGGSGSAAGNTSTITTSNGGGAAASAAVDGGHVHQSQAKKRARATSGEADEAGKLGGGAGSGAGAALREGAMARREAEEEEEPEEDCLDRLNAEEEEGEGDLDLMDEAEEEGGGGGAGDSSSRTMAARARAAAAAAVVGGITKRRVQVEAAALADAAYFAYPLPAGGSTALVGKSGAAGGQGTEAGLVPAAGGKGKGRPEMVRRVEKLVAVLFKELDVLLRAEDINRRVMYRWSGAVRSSNAVLGEGKTSYCTWGRELIKQYIEDAIEVVRKSLASGEWDTSVEAARRVTLLYLGKAAERAIIENEPVLHAEVMNALGNLWFALLPYMPPPQRQQFRRLVARIRKTGGGANAASAPPRTAVQASSSSSAPVLATPAAAGIATSPGTGAMAEVATAKAAAPAEAQGKAPGGRGSPGAGDDASSCTGGDGDGVSGLVVSFRCALEFAKLDLSPETLAAQGPAVTRTQLAALLVSDVYDCDAFICLWKVSEVLAGLADFHALCQEFRLKALDAEMWRCMLLEEQETRQRQNSESDSSSDEDDYSDDDEEDDMVGMEEYERLRWGQGRGRPDGQGGRGGGDRLTMNKLATIPGVVGIKKFESTQQQVQRSAVVAAAAAAAPQQQQSPQKQQQPPRVSFLPAAPAPAPSTPVAAVPVPAAAAAAAPAVPAPASAARRGGAPVLDSVGSSRFSSLRRSSVLDGQGSGSRLGAAAGNERWRTKAALEDADYDQQMDFLSLHQHEYRRVMTPDFLFRVWTFLEAFDPVSAAPAASGGDGAEASPRTSNGGSGDASSSFSSLGAVPVRLIFIRARPFLYRVATMVPTEELPGYLDLLAAKFGYQDTLQLLEPLIVDDHERVLFSTGRVAQALEWAIGCDNGKHLPLFTRLLLPRIQSRTQLERIARRAVAYGLPSLPIVDRALARVPRHNYEALAVALCRRAVECWGAGRGAHLVVLRALQGTPSLALYLKCRGCFLDPTNSLVRPLVHQLDPTGELSIGIRLVEGHAQSAVNSIVLSVEGTREGSPERPDRGRRWLDFCLAGVRGGQFPPGLLDRLFAARPLVLAALGPPSKDPSCLEALAGCFAKLADVVRRSDAIPPAAINGAVRSVIAMYTTQPHEQQHAALPKDALLRVALEKGVEMEEAIEVAA